MNKIRLLFLILLLVSTSSCNENFEELNTNPNGASEVSAGLILPRVIEGLTTASYRFAFEDGMLISQHLASINDNAKDQYFWVPNATHWNTFYDLLRNIENIYTLGKEENHETYQGIALLLRSYAYLQLTSSYGDVPYSEAISAKSGQIFTPKYDTQELIFDGILTDLEQANLLINEDGKPIVGDILYNGDLLKWKKLTNSLRLRVLLRVSDKVNVNQTMQNIVSNYPIFQSNTDNAYLQYLSTEPYRFYYSTLREEDFNKRRLSFFADSILTSLNDTRLTAHYRPTDASLESGVPEYVGIPNGLTEERSAVFNGGGRNVSRIGTRYRENPIGGIGIIMHYAELQFILAEAAEKGLINENSNQFYQQGIQADMEFLSIPFDDSYLQQELVVLNNTQENNLEKILTQKWISLWGIGTEAWFNWRRTGYPNIQPATDNLNDNRIPVRFLYPTSESLLNTSNYQVVLQQQGADDINTLMWLLK